MQPKIKGLGIFDTCTMRIYVVGLNQTVDRGWKTDRNTPKSINQL